MKNGPPPPNSAISLPFIIVHTDKDTYIDCSISTDKCVHVCIIVFTYGTDEACMSTLNVFALLCVCTPVWFLRNGEDRRMYQDVYCVCVRMWACVHAALVSLLTHLPPIYTVLHVAGLNMCSTLTSPLPSMMTWMC